MKIAIIGAGNIGGHLAKQFSRAGHEVVISFSRDQQKLQQQASSLGQGVRADSVAEAVRQSDVIVLSCLWADIDSALAEAGDMSGKIVIDATNPYTPSGLVELPASVAEYNQARMPGAKIIRTFHMFTAEFQQEVSNGDHQPVAIFFAAEDASVKTVAEKLIACTGFTPVYVGGWDVVKFIDIPAGIILGKSYSPADAQKIADAIQQGDERDAKRLADELARGTM